MAIFNSYAKSPEDGAKWLLFTGPNSKTIPHRASAACIMALETPKALSLATCELISGKLWPCLPQVSPQFVDVQKENQSN